VLQSFSVRRLRIDHTAALLTSLHPLSPLQRGYAVIERNGMVINASEPINPGDTIEIRRQHDVLAATVQSVHQRESTTGTSHGNDQGHEAETS